MNINNEELISNLPTKWKDITLQQYIQLVENLPSEKEDGESDSAFIIKVVSAFIYAFTGHNIQYLKLTVNAVQQHLIKEDFDFFKLILAIPITASLIEIIGSVERATGVQMVDKVKEIIKSWVSTKLPNPNNANNDKVD